MVLHIAIYCSYIESFLGCDNNGKTCKSRVRIGASDYLCFQNFKEYAMGQETLFTSVLPSLYDRRSNG